MESSFGPFDTALSLIPGGTADTPGSESFVGMSSGPTASLPRVGARLADLLDHDSLLRLAGSRSYERGCDYVEWGAVGRIEVSDVQVEASVQGASDAGCACTSTGRDWAFGALVRWASLPWRS